MAVGVTTSSAVAAAGAQAANNIISMDQDGLGLAPTQVLAQLSALAAAQPVGVDQYGVGGSIEAAEQYFAQLLGKPYALFMPTGTLANQLALRVLAGDERRVLVQEMGHVYNDSGDASQTLSGLTLLPLAPQRATFTLADVQQALGRTASGRVLTRVGALCIESPVRRAFGELFDWNEALRICAFAQEMGIRTHLDGARLFIASAYTGIAPAEYARPFDAVYVSLWKCFNCLNGAMLAFSDRTLDERLRALRRMYGGALFNAWPFALLARHYAEGFVDRLKQAIAVSEAFMAALAAGGRPTARIERGTNLFKLPMALDEATRLRHRLQAENIVLPRPGILPDGTHGFMLHVNESWNALSGQTLAAKFLARG